MKRLALTLMVAGIPLVSVSLFTPVALFGDDALPSVQAVMDHWIAATGGRAAWEARHNLVEHATLDFAKQGIKGTLTVYQAEPDKYLGVTDLAGIGKLATGSNGQVAWENTVVQGPRLKQGSEKADALRDGAFNGDLRWQTLYARAVMVGVETVEGHQCYKVVFTPSEGQTVVKDYDKTSGLLVKTATTVESPIGQIPAEIVYDDYQKDAGVLTPHRMLNRAAQQEFVIQIQSIETNVDLAKDRFDVPPEVQALLKKEAPTESKPAATAVNKASAAPDHGKLTVYMGGNPVATENYTITKSPDGGLDIDGSGSATIGPMKIDIDKFEVIDNAKYQPVEAIAKSKLGAIQMNVHTTFADGVAKNEIDSGQGPQSKDVPVDPGAVVVNSNLPLYPWSVLAMRASFGTQEPQKFPIYILGQSEVVADVVFKARERVDFAGQSAELNHLTVSGTPPQGQPISVDFWVDDSRKLIKVAVPSQGVEAYQEGFEPRQSAKAAEK